MKDLFGFLMSLLLSYHFALKCTTVLAIPPNRQAGKIQVEIS